TAMAERELKKILEQAKTKWPLGSLGIVHRTGNLKVGECSLLVVVQAPHRKEAFAALQFVIDAIKQKVPIWKKEFYEKTGRHTGRWQEPAVWER
ncbi:MAG: molybdenum cofactor biosynthesis protein MoaE, partial [Deltaproteobacteria bacterium]|nr:molybdenum cofactor biosynthesis protein MoaE [Deltaproteobacteria bacterium]